MFICGDEVRREKEDARQDQSNIKKGIAREKITKNLSDLNSSSFIFTSFVLYGCWYCL